MGSYTFHKDRAMEMLVTKVSAGVEATADEIAAMAKDLAPVRKQGRRKKRTTEVGGTREKHQFSAGRNRKVAVTGGQFWEAFDRLPTQLKTYRAADGSTKQITRAQFRKMRMTTSSQRRKVVTPEEFDTRAGNAASGTTRGITRGSSVTEPEGHLRDRINVGDTQSVDGKITVSVISPARYSRYVEFPTHRTAAQPFLLPAFKAARSRLKANIKAAKGG